VPSKTWPSIEAQFDSTSQPQMEDLLSRKFGSSKEDIVLRAIHLYYQILEHEKKGFRLGYLNTKGKFIAIDLFEK
jgi:hypothetical protein